MKFKNPFSQLTPFELILWLFSVFTTVAAFALSGGQSFLNATAAIIGVTALIFVAKGYVIGQILTIVFAVIYGLISFHFRYYGEMITYLFMTSPIAAMTAVEWHRHPYGQTKEVTVSSVTKKQISTMLILTLPVTSVFYFFLSSIGNASIVFSTISVATSFIASCLTYLRSPYYAIGYAANDTVLILLWSIAAADDFSYFPMVICFAMFLINDLYGFVSWRKMKVKQSI